MAGMGRRRKDNPLGLPARVYAKHGAFYYVHRDGRWERLGAEVADAHRKAALYNDPKGAYGTMVYWLDLFLVDCEKRVESGSLAKRTLADYQNAIGTAEAPGTLRIYFAPPMTPEAITPTMVQDFLDIGAKAGRPVPANRERSCLSSCLSWLIRSGKVPGLKVNVCLRASGVKRNPESKRERYVTHTEYREVWAEASNSVRLMMGLTYRTLQRPESDIIGWTPANIVRGDDGRRRIKFRQNKTGHQLEILIDDEIDRLVRDAMGEVPQLHQPLVHNRKGERYTYTGLNANLTRAIGKVNKKRLAAGQPKMPPFGFRDLKGKGATDMAMIDKVPIRQIQLLLGHASVTTTEIYIKQRWREAVEPNAVKLG